MAGYATVVLDINVDRAFDYRIPEPLAGAVRPGVRVVVPFRSRRMVGYVVAVGEGEPRAGARPIASVRDETPIIGERLLSLAGWMASYYGCPLPTAIAAILPAGIRRGAGAKMPLFVRLRRDRLDGLGPPDGLRARAPAQARILDRLLEGEGPAEASVLLRRAGAAHAALRSLERKGAVELRRARVWRDPWEGAPPPAAAPHLPTTPEQERALARLREEVRAGRFSVTLLHGVTGSGKTEVYLQAIAAALAAGRGAIVLVPEISLTPQTVGRFRERFGRGVAVLHSRLSAGERFVEWERMRAREARIAVGARSAVFAPIPDLGLIVVDEEHERSYKQEDAPRYHARDAAITRGSLEGAAVLLGSATPSVESYWNAAAGRYALFRLPRRIDDRPMPRVAIVDMQEEGRRTGRTTFFSRRLLGAMEERLGRGEQVILFLNRRGFSPLMLCRRCGWVEKCPHCSVSLTSHGAGETLICHLCGFSRGAPARCPSCGSPNLRFPGLGTQKLEAMVSRLFPERRVGRMDTDAMTGRHAHAETLGAFGRGEIQILLGTQMIAKGLHFPNVTLVGVICADTALHLPDFRASEYTFQILTQVAGRAGRGERAGEVIIQTYAPGHPAILAARDGDDELFYRREIGFREELGYPPLKRLVLVTVKGRNGEAVKWIARHCAREFAGALPPAVDVLGPAPSPVQKVRGRYRWQIVLKGEAVPPMTAAVGAVLGRLRPGGDVQFAVDADPVSML
ncbi:MAG: primosomal protein N' [bacterium]|nr:primosomal protein N' [bacterium]